MNSKYYQFYYFSTGNRGQNPQYSELLITPKDKSQIHESSYYLYCGAFLDNAVGKNPLFWGRLRGYLSHSSLLSQSSLAMQPQRKTFAGEKGWVLPIKYNTSSSTDPTFYSFLGISTRCPSWLSHCYRAAECYDLKVGLHPGLSVQHGHPHCLVSVSLGGN